MRLLLQRSKFRVTKVASSMTKAACASMLNEHPETATLGGALGCCMEAKALGFEEKACAKAARAIMRLGLGLKVTMTRFSSGGAAFRRKARGEDQKLWHTIVRHLSNIHRSCDSRISAAANAYHSAYHQPEHHHQGLHHPGYPQQGTHDQGPVS